MNRYETVFILTPVLSDEQMKETVAKFKKLLTDNGAEIVNEEAWGLKKMAYAIQKKSTGFYCLLEFKLSLQSSRLSRQAIAATRKLFVTSLLNSTSMQLSMQRSELTSSKKRRLKTWQQ